MGQPFFLCSGVGGEGAGRVRKVWRNATMALLFELEKDEFLGACVCNFVINF